METKFLQDLDSYRRNIELFKVLWWIIFGLLKVLFMWANFAVQF